MTMKLLWDWMKKNREGILYLFVGGLTTLVSLVIYYGCVFTFLNPDEPMQLQLANVISWIGAVAFAYVTNRILVFRSKNEKVFSEVARFVGMRVFTLLVDMLFMGVWVSVLEFSDKPGKLISQVVVVLLNYVFSKRFVFT